MTIYNCPTLEDYHNRISWILAEAQSKSEKSIYSITNRHVLEGRGGGNLCFELWNKLEVEFEETLDLMLLELDRIIKMKSIKYDLFTETFKLLLDHCIRVQNLIDFPAFMSPTVGLLAERNKKRDRLNAILKHRLRQFEIGFESFPERISMIPQIQIGTNNAPIVGGDNSGVVINTISSPGPIQLALEEIELEIKKISGLSEEIRDDLLVDLRTIRDQITKNRPNLEILGFAHKTIKSVAESVATNVASDRIIIVLDKLAKLIGLS